MQANGRETGGAHGRAAPHRASIGPRLRRAVARARPGDDALPRLARGGLLLRAPAKPVLERAGRALRRAGASLERGACGIRPRAPHSPLGRARLVHDRAGLRCEHRRPRPQRPFGRPRRRACRSRVHHRREGGSALPEVQRRFSESAATRRAALHEPRERPDAPSRPGRSVPAHKKRAPPRERSAPARMHPMPRPGGAGAPFTRQAPYRCRTPRRPPWTAPS